jgi:hypothetical protein
MRGWLLFVPTLPWSLTVWGLGLLSVVLGLANGIRWKPAGWMTLVWRPVVASRWHFSTTLGRVTWFHPDHHDIGTPGGLRILRHEAVHVRQVEDAMLLSILVGLGAWAWSGSWGLGLVIWASGGAWQLPGFLTAAIRYGWKGIYRDHEAERAAYSQTDYWPGGSSYWDQRDLDRLRQKGVLR